LAKKAADIVVKNTAFVNGLAAKTAKSEALFQAIKDKNTASQKKNTGLVAAAKAAQKMTLQNCKVRGYNMAQVAKKTKDASDKAIAADRIKYAAEIKAPVDGAAGTRCELPKIAAGVQGARTACNKTTCCGQAWKINRDGSVSRIESCQASAAMTYTYKAPWLATANRRPAAETWPFVCLFTAEAMKDNKLATPFPLPGYDLKPKPAPAQ